MKQRSTDRGWGRKGDKQKALTGDQDGCWVQEKREAPDGAKNVKPMLRAKKIKPTPGG